MGRIVWPERGRVGLARTVGLMHSARCLSFASVRACGRESLITVPLNRSKKGGLHEPLPAIWSYLYFGRDAKFCELEDGRRQLQRHDVMPKVELF